MSRTITIERLPIGLDHLPVIVAEIGQNHNGSVDEAIQLSRVARSSGCDAIKLTKRTVDRDMTTEMHKRPYNGRDSFGKTYGAHRHALELDPEAWSYIKQVARMPLIGTVCDVCAAADVAEIVDAFKIASRDADNLPLIRCVLSLGKPVIVSTGMSSWNSIRRIIELADTLGMTDQIVLMHCVSLYPTTAGEANLSAIAEMRFRFGDPVGYSDHTIGTTAAPCAVQHGASIIEKHITMSKLAKGSDHKLSIERDELRTMVASCHRSFWMRGDGAKDEMSSSNTSRMKLGRSIVSRIRIHEGNRIQESDLTLASPGDGIRWEQRREVIGAIARRTIEAMTTIREGDLICQT